MPRISRFKRKASDRSGFNCYEIEMVKDGAYKVSAEEYDTPPPSKISLGGGGDVSRGAPARRAVKGLRSGSIALARAFSAFLQPEERQAIARGIADYLSR